MVSKCLVSVCKNKGRHALPKNPAQRSLWLKAMKCEGRELKLKTNLVCSVHFKDSDYTMSYYKDDSKLFQQKFLKRHAVPSIFSWKETNDDRQELHEDKNFDEVIISLNEEHDGRHDIVPGDMNFINFDELNFSDSASSYGQDPLVLFNSSSTSISDLASPIKSDSETDKESIRFDSSKVKNTYSKLYAPLKFVPEFPIDVTNDVTKNPLSSEEDDFERQYEYFREHEIEVGNSIDIIEDNSFDCNIKQEENNLNEEENILADTDICHSCGKKKMPTNMPKKAGKDEKKEEVEKVAKNIDATDEMKIKMLAGLDKPEPEDLLYPPELNAHLLEQLKVMTAENGELRKCIFTKDCEIEELNKTVASVNQRIRDIISGSAPGISSKSAAIISAKITDLCKTNRHLVAEIEGYKSKNAGLERKVLQLELIAREHENLDICTCKEEPPDFEPSKLKELNSKLDKVNKRLSETMNKNYELKKEILLATNILQQELGVKITNLKGLQNDIAGWKSRAEQIVKLQAKITELEEKLGEKKDDKSKPKRQGNSEIIKHMTCKNKKEIDDGLKELKILREENANLKYKLEGNRCRIKHIECDNNVIKMKMQTLFEKSNHDDQLINEQREQIKAIELYYQELLRENTNKMNIMNAESMELKHLLQTTDDKIDALHTQSAEKAAKIEELRAQLLRYEECSLQSIFFTPMKTATDNEIKRLSELVKSLNERLDEERCKTDHLDLQLRRLKERKKRLEKKLHDTEEELKIYTQPKKKTRSQISRFGSEATKISSSDSFDRRKESASHNSDEVTLDSLDKADLKYKLELNEERLKILEDKLKMIEEEKKEDIETLTDMIHSSKQLFNEALAVLQKEKCMCY